MVSSPVSHNNAFRERVADNASMHQGADMCNTDLPLKPSSSRPAGTITGIPSSARATPSGYRIFSACTLVVPHKASVITRIGHAKQRKRAGCPRRQLRRRLSHPESLRTTSPPVCKSRQREASCLCLRVSKVVASERSSLPQWHPSLKAVHIVSRPSMLDRCEGMSTESLQPRSAIPFVVWLAITV